MLTTGNLAQVSPLLNASVVAAALTASVSAAGWFIVKWVDVRAQTQLRKAEFRRGYVQKQIEEFYGPLYSLVWQILATNNLMMRMLSQPKLSTQEKQTVEEYFTTKHFVPMHERVKEIMTTKLYLLDGTMMPESFYEYLRHSLQSSAQRELWFDKGVSTSFIAGIPYPDSFQRTILNSLTKLTKEYELNVQALKGQRPADEVQAVSGEDPRFSDAR